MNTSRKTRSKRIRIILAAALAIFCAATIYAAASSSYRVTIYYGDEVKTITTMREEVSQILTQAGITTQDTDFIDDSEFSSGTESIIRVYNAGTIKVYDNSEDYVEYTAVGTVKKALEDNGIVLDDADELNYNLDDTVYDGMSLIITRAFDVKIKADGKTTTVKLAGGTVSDALDAAVIALDDDDEISKPLDTQLKKGMTIKITRVEYKETVKTKKIKFETKKVNSNTIYQGQTKIKTKGENGEKVVRLKEKYINGKLKSTETVSEKVTKKPVTQIVLVGTKSRGVMLASGKKTISTITPPSSLQLDKHNVPTSYKRKIVGTASGYSGGGHTATGRIVKPGYIAVNPNQIPYHSKMWIVSNDGRYVYGYSSAEDTGGFIYWTGSRSTVCDLYFATEAQASAFGRRSVTIYIL